MHASLIALLRSVRFRLITFSKKKQKTKRVPRFLNRLVKLDRCLRIINTFFLWKFELSLSFHVCIIVYDVDCTVCTQICSTNSTLTRVPPKEKHILIIRVSRKFAVSLYMSYVALFVEEARHKVPRVWKEREFRNELREISGIRSIEKIEEINSIRGTFCLANDEKRRVLMLSLLKRRARHLSLARAYGRMPQLYPTMVLRLVRATV